MRTCLKILFYLVWTFLSTLLGQLFAFLFCKLLFGNNFSSSPSLETIYSLISYSLSAIFAIFLPFWFIKRSSLRYSRTSLGIKGLPTFTDIGLAPVALILVLLTSAFLTNLFTIFPWFNVSEVQDVGYNFIYSGWDRFIAFLALVIIAPISEELIFRGYLYGHLRELIPKKFSIPLSIFLVSALFALLHGQWNVALTVFCLSVFSCTLREITGTIYSGIFLHILKNAIAFYLIYVVNMV